MSRDYRQVGIEGKTHYKLYKSGKLWVSTGITVFSLGLGLTFTQLDQVKAATQTSSSDSGSSSSVSSDESSISSKTVVLKTSDTSSSDSSVTSSTSSAASQSSSVVSDTQATSADKTSSVASSSTSGSENASNPAASSTSSTSVSVSNSSSAASSDTLSSSSQDKSAKTTSTSTSNSTTKASESKTLVSSTDTSTTSAASSKTNSVSGTETTDDSSSAGDTKVVSDVASESTSTTVNDTDTNTDNLSTVNSNNAALTTEKTALAAAVATKATRASLARAAATNSVEWVTTGTVNIDYGTYTQGLGGVTQVIDNPNLTVASGEPNLALYAKDASGGYLVDDKGNRVNLLYSLIRMGNTSTAFTVSYTNEAGVTSDVSGTEWTTLSNAGTYTITLTADGEEQITEINDLGNWGGYTFSDDTDVDSFMPTMDSFSGTYTAQIVITPATIVNGNGNTGNTITLGNAVQYYNGKSVTMLPQVTVSGADSGTVLRIVGGAVTNQSGTAVNVKDVILTSDDFDYTYSDGTSNLTKYDAGTYTLTLNTAGIAAMQKALGQNYNLIGYDDTGDPNIVGKGTVKKVALGLATSTKTTTYNGTAQGTDVSVASGSNYDNIVFTTSTGTNVNTSTNYPDGYTMTVVTADANQAAILAKNYTVTETDGTLTITPALLTVTTNDNPVTYDGQAHGTTVAVTGDNYDNLAFNAVSKDDGGTTTYINAGTYTMIGTTSGDTSNYTITYKNGTITIAKAAATITIPSKTYWADGTTKNLTSTVTVTGTVNKESLNYTLTDGLQATGTKSITANYDESDSVNQNYDITVVPGTLTVGDVTVEYDYGYKDASGNFVLVTSDTGKASHGTDASASDYLAYTTDGQPKTGYTFSTNDTGLAANGTLSGIGGVVKYVYLANNETVNIVYYDQTDKKEITTVTRSGQYGTTDSYTTADAIAAYEKAGYQFVDSDFPSDGISYNVDGVQTYTVLLAHKMITVDVTTPGTPGEPIDSDNPDGPKYPEGTDIDSLSSTSKRTINYIYATSNTIAANAVVQSTTFNRTATIDEVTGKVTYYSDWLTTDGDSQGTCAQVTSPTITGYTPDQTNIVTAAVNQGDKDSEVLVTYTANDESATVTFQDSTTGKQLGEVVTRTGKYGTTDSYSPQSTIDSYLKSGYQLDSSSFPAGGIVFNEDGTVKNYTIYLSHKMTTVDVTTPGVPGDPIDPNNPDGPKYPAGTDVNSLNKTITRTINYNYADVGKGQAADSVTQSVIFNRVGTIDEVTGEVTYTTWTTTDGNTQGSFDTVDSPKLTGYTADKVNVADLTVDEAATDSVVDVTYATNDEKTTVTFIDATTGKQLGDTITRTGKYGTTDSYSPQSTIDSYLKGGYQLDASDFPAGGIVFDENGTGYTITLSHKTTTVNTNNPGTPGEPIDSDNPDGPKYPAGTDINSLNKTVTRTINYYYDTTDGKKAADTVTQSVTFNRIATIDEVTGAVTYTTWLTTENAPQGSFATVVSPAITGFTASQKSVGSATVSETTADSTLDVVYTVNTETAKVTFIDSTTGKTLVVKDLSGNYGTTDPYSPQATIDSYLKAGYQLDSSGSDFPTGGVVYNQDGTVKAYTIKLSHKMTNVTVDNPGTPGDPIDPENPDGPKYPAETDLSALNKTVTRTINYYYAGTDKKQAADTVTQSVEFKRSATIDEVTGAVTYTNWLTTDNATQGNYASVDSTKITGYTPSQDSVASGAVNKDDSDSTVEVTYAANTETAKVIFVDATTKQPLYEQNLTGTYGASDNYSPQATIDAYVKKGYQMDHSDFPAGGVVYDDDGVVKSYTITLSHKIKTVDVKTPGTPGQPIDSENPDGPKYPAGTDKASLGKTITRTITYQYQDKSHPATSVQQHVGFERTATIDEVTGKVTYGQWLATGTEEATGSYDRVDTPQVTGYTADKTSVASKTVTNADSDSQVTVTYVANSVSVKVVYIDSTTGKTLATDIVSGQFGTHSIYTTQSRIDEYTKAGYVLITDGFPAEGIVFSQNDGNYVVYAAHGKAQVTDTKVVTQTIHYRDQDGKTIYPDTVKSITFTRSGIVDQVTGEATYSAWTTDSDSEFSAVDAPEVTGYEVVTKATQSVVINANSEDNEQTLVYEKIAEPETEQPEADIVQESPVQKPRPTQVSEKSVRRTAPQPIKQVKTISKVETTKATQERPVNKAKTLPQTNDDQRANLTAELLGLSLATLLIGVGFISRKRHE